MEAVNEERDALKTKLRDREYRETYAEGFLNDSIALRIRSLREHRGLTQAELAERADMRQGAISRIEQGDYGKWTISTLKKVAQALDAPLSVRFESWGAFVEEVLHLDPEALHVPKFEADPAFTAVPVTASTAVDSASNTYVVCVGMTQPTAVGWPSIRKPSRSEERKRYACA